MQLLTPILIGGFVPAAIIALILLAASRFRPAVLRKRIASLVAPLAVGIAFLPVEYAAHGIPSFWPPDSTYRMAHIAVLATALAVLGTLIKRPRLVHKIITLVPFPATAWVLLETLHPHYLNTPTLAAWIVAVAAAGWGMNAVMIRVSRGSGAAPSLLSLTMAAGGLAACSMLSHSATVAQLGAGLAAITGGGLVAILIRPKIRFKGGGITVCLVLLAGLLLLVHHFVEVPVRASLLLVATPLAASIARLPFLGSRSPAIRWTVIILAASAAPALAAYITYGDQSAMPY